VAQEPPRHQETEYGRLERQKVSGSLQGWAIVRVFVRTFVRIVVAIVVAIVVE